MVDTIQGYKRENKAIVNETIMNEVKTTEEGYINKNNQQNNGRTTMSGTDYNQYLYEMECLNCGHKYYANGSDIWLRKCPNCQGGKS